MPTPPKYSNQFLRLLMTKFRTQRKTAAHLGVTASRFTRWMNGERLSVESCLRLADALGGDPAVVLRLYDYEDEAAILDRQYPDRRGRRPQGEVTLLTKIAKLTPGRRQLVEQLVDELGSTRKRR